jgi:glycosyltransferase involved in cell wall biosynthesis
MKNKNNYPFVTIGIPTYNRAKSYLKQAIKCALDQTYPNLEVIVSDNCSTDNTESLAKSFTSPRLRYFRQVKNIGASNNFNFCLSEAKGDFFLMLHDDDLVDQDFIETCLKYANYNTDIGVIRTGTRVIDGEGNILRESPNNVGGLPIEEFFRGWFNYKTSWYLCSTLFNTQKLREIGGLQSKHQLLQDGYAIVKLVSKYDRVDVQEIKASFRKHEGEITHATSVKYWCEDFISLLNLMYETVTVDKEIIRTEGERFFAKLNYNRASEVKSRLKRFIAYFIVFRKFHYRYVPPPFRRLIYQNYLSLLIRRKI